MMDDFRPERRPLPRRDYSGPVHRPAHYSPRDDSQPAAPPPRQPAAAPPHHPAHHQTPAHHHTAPRPKNRSGLRYLGVGGALLLAAAIFTAGYIYKSKAPDKTLPAAVVSRAKFDVFFPSPMPAGYTYVSKTATFQIGEVFYRFADGQKSVTVREEPLPAQKPDLGLYKGYSRFTAAAGQAAIGSSFGQPVAVIVTPTTVITMNTGGGVTAQDLKTAINNLKNIGQPGQ